MVSVNVCIKNEMQALRFADMVRKYHENVFLKTDNAKLDAKSVLSILGMAVAKPAEVQIDGEAPGKLLSALKEYRI